MRILMITGDRALASGKQAAFHNTLQELHKHFERIDVICPHVSVRRYDMSVFGNVYVHPSPWPLIFQPLWIVWRGRRLLRNHGHQAMVVNNYPPYYNGVGAMVLHWLTKVPWLMEVFHIEGYPHPASMRQRLWRWWTATFARYFTRSAAAVRVMNEHEVPDFLTRHGVDATKIRLVPAVYIDLDTFKPTEVPKQYDLIFVGRLVGNKGLDLFLDVLRRTGLVGVVVGEGPLLPWARRWSRRNGLKVHFAGFAPDAAAVADLINRSKLLMMTSLNEGGPRVVPESLACGVPVVATPVGIVPDILPPECIEEWNAADLSDKVRNILGDPMLYERLRQSGLAVAPRFERAVVIKGYADAIKQLAPHA